MHTELTPSPDATGAFGPQARYALNGPTMGTRYAAVFFEVRRDDIAAIAAALQASVDEVDEQMSTWKPESDLMAFNAAPVGMWMTLPAELLTVIDAGLAIGLSSHGAFDIGTGDLVSAWGFDRKRGVPDVDALHQLAKAVRVPAHSIIERDATGGRLRKLAPIAIDLSGIAKGYGVDRLAETLEAFGVANYLVSIDGEVRARGRKAGGEPWRIAVEQPGRGVRDIGGIVALEDGALATSGDYRHFVEHDGKTYAHTMDPRGGRPVQNGVSAVTVRAATCMLADAWATALLVAGPDLGRQLAASNHIEAVFAVKG